MKAAKFCRRNVERTEAAAAVSLLQKEYSTEVEVWFVDCFQRCLRCHVQPFSRVQLTTIEDDDAYRLVDRIMDHVRQA